MKSTSYPPMILRLPSMRHLICLKQRNSLMSTSMRNVSLSRYCLRLRLCRLPIQRRKMRLQLRQHLLSGSHSRCQPPPLCLPRSLNPDPHRNRSRLLSQNLHMSPCQNLRGLPTLLTVNPNGNLRHNRHHNPSQSLDTAVRGIRIVTDMNMSDTRRGAGIASAAASARTCS